MTSLCHLAAPLMPPFLPGRTVALPWYLRVVALQELCLVPGHLPEAETRDRPVSAEPDSSFRGLPTTLLTVVSPSTSHLCGQDVTNISQGGRASVSSCLLLQAPPVKCLSVCLSVCPCSSREFSSSPLQLLFVNVVQQINSELWVFTIKNQPRYEWVKNDR